MKIARIYLRVSTDEQDLTRQAEIEHTALDPLAITLLVSIERKHPVPAPTDQSFSG